MIDYYRLPKKKKGVENDEILVVNEEYELKDAIHNKSINNIKVLIMRNSNINDETLSLLWTMTQTLPIVHLNLAQNFSFVTDVGVDNICQAMALRNLKILNLADNSLTDQSLKKLSMTNHFINIQELTLYGNSDISSEGLMYLAESSNLKNIKKLDLHDTSVDDSGMKFLIKSPNSTYLTHLNLSMNNTRITDESLMVISMSKYCDSLVQLRLQDCCISDQGIKFLCDSPNCRKIQNLILNNSISKRSNSISDQSLKLLTYAKQMNKLKILELRNTEITSNGINSLSISLASENFQIVRFSYCIGINDEAVLYLESIIKYRNLTKLYLNSTMVSQQSCKKLGEKYPAVNIIY